PPYLDTIDDAEIGQLFSIIVNGVNCPAFQSRVTTAFPMEFVCDGGVGIGDSWGSSDGVLFQRPTGPYYDVPQTLNVVGSVGRIPGRRSLGLGFNQTAASRWAVTEHCQ